MKSLIKKLVKKIKKKMQIISFQVTGIRDKRDLENKWFRYRSKHYPKYNTNDIIAKFREYGITKGDTLFLHSSWDKFINYTGAPKELIQALIELVGSEGTLAMPAFPITQNAEKIFDIRHTPSGAGYLTEIFRRFKGVKRSINLNHSVCAYGPNAEYLIKDHHKAETSWDENSPYYRLKNVKAKIAGLGVGHNLKIATSLHCVDSALWKEVKFYNMLFPYTVTYQYRDQNNNMGTHTFYKRVGKKLDTRKIARYMDRKELKEGWISNLDIYLIRADYLIDRASELGRQGITMYVNPKPRKALFYSIKQ